MFKIISIKGNSVRVGFCRGDSDFTVFVDAAVEKNGDKLTVVTPRGCYIRPDVHTTFIGAVLTAYENSLQEV